MADKYYNERTSQQLGKRVNAESLEEGIIAGLLHDTIGLNRQRDCCHDNMVTIDRVLPP